MPTSFDFAAGVERAEPDLLVLIAFGLLATTAVVHLMFALAVFFDARRLSQSPLETLWFVPATIWALATLLGGVFVAAVYWVMHHSSFARPIETPAAV